MVRVSIHHEDGRHYYQKFIGNFADSTTPEQREAYTRDYTMEISDAAWAEYSAFVEQCRWWDTYLLNQSNELWDKRNAWKPE